MATAKVSLDSRESHDEGGAAAAAGHADGPGTHRAVHGAVAASSTGLRGAAASLLVGLDLGVEVSRELERERGFEGGDCAPSLLLGDVDPFVRSQ